MAGLLSILMQKPIFSIREDVGLQLGFLALQILEGKAEFSAEAFQLKAADPYPVSLLPDGQPLADPETAADPSPSSKIQVIPIHGVLMPEDQMCGPSGTLTKARNIRKAADDETIHGILLDLMTPGGHVLGTEECANAIAYARTKKPVIAYVNGECCSGGYRLAIEADEIIINGHTAELGSIGVLLHYLDHTKKLKKEGIEVVKILSSKSPRKTFNYSEPNKEDIQLIQSEFLDPLADAFHQAVQSRRQVDPEVLQGAVYIGKKTIELGLADRMGTYEGALQILQETIQKRNMSLFGKKKTAQEEIPAAVENNQEQLHQEESPAAEASAEASTEAAAAQADPALQQAQQKITSMEGMIASMKSQHESAVKELKAEISALKAAPVNEVADPAGHESAPESDAADQAAAAGSPWAGPWDAKED